VPKGMIKSPNYVFSVLILPAVYISFLLTHGHITGNYIYPIFDINVLGLINVILFILIVTVAFLGLAFLLYFIDAKMGRVATSKWKGSA
jgi:hypothetical protein